MDKNMEISNRIKEVRLALDKSQAEFCKLVSMPQSTYAYLEIGRTQIRDRHISLICSGCNVNENWLRTGEGQMFNLIDDKNINIRLGEALSKILLESDEVSKKLILSLVELEPEELSVINNLVEMLIKKKK